MDAKQILQKINFFEAKGLSDFKQKVYEYVDSPLFRYVPLEIAVKILSFVNSQIYGQKFARYIADNKEWRSIPGINDLGDFLTQNGNVIEFKTSFVTKYRKTDRANIVQIRLDQKIDYYVFAYVNTTHQKHICNFYVLRNADMQMEAETAPSAHRVRAKSTERRLTLTPEMLERWNKTYKVKYSFLSKL